MVNISRDDWNKMNDSNKSPITIINGRQRCRATKLAKIELHRNCTNYFLFIIECLIFFSFVQIESVWFGILNENDVNSQFTFLHAKWHHFAHSRKRCLHHRASLPISNRFYFVFVILSNLKLCQINLNLFVRSFLFTLRRHISSDRLVVFICLSNGACSP